jgi:anaerobic magnesium-protoporphyrin IX monomethyl ester cyclase
MIVSKSPPRPVIKALFLSPPHPLKDSFATQRQAPLSLLNAIRKVIGICEVVLLDLAHRDDARQLDVVLREYKPDLIGITTMTYNYSSTIRLIETIKAMHPQAKIVVGGMNIKHLGEEVFRTTLADYIVYGDGEDVLEEFILNGLSVDGLAGIVSRCGKGTPTIRHAENIDGILPYMFSFIDNYRDTFFPLLTQRGCAFQCVFCSMSQSRTRFRSDDDTFHELNYLFRNGIRNIFISNDTFNLDLRWAKSFLRRINEEYGDYFRIVVNLRANAIDDELVELLKSVSCKRAFLGLESGSDRILENIQKRETAADMADGVAKLKRVGIETSCSFVIGLPGETTETVRETISYARDVDPHMAVFNVCIPFPGTPIYENTDQFDLIIHDRKWFLKGIPNEPIISTTGLSRKEIQRMTALCYKEFYGG